jgi:hypothetical protein
MADSLTVQIGTANTYFAGLPQNINFCLQAHQRTQRLFISRESDKMSGFTSLEVQQIEFWEELWLRLL